MKGLGYLLLIVGGLVMGLGTLGSMFRYIPREIPTWAIFSGGIVIMLIGGILSSSGEMQDFKPSKSMINTENSYPCPVCGQKDFTWGMMASPSAPRFRRSMIGLIGTGTPVLTRLCNHCGNLVLFAQQKRP